MSELLVTTENGIATLTLNRPEKRNALNDTLIESLKAALANADRDNEISVVLIDGAGNDFCSGADLAGLQRIATASYEENLADAKSLAELFAIIRKVRVPVIAAVHGRALAGGCGLATACDLVVASRSARFGYPEVKIGFVPAMVTVFLRRNISEKRAFEMITQGFEFSAQQALDIGLVNRIFDEATFEKNALEYASVYAKLSRSAVQMGKRLLYEMDAMSFDDSMLFGAGVNAQARMTDDCQNGIRRFLGKSL